MNELLLENNEVLKEILLATTILSNNSNPNWIKDCSKLINFICSAYGVEELADEYINIVTTMIKPHKFIIITSNF